MTVTDQIKILISKIKQNESQYDLGRETAKISALFSKNLIWIIDWWRFRS